MALSDAASAQLDRLSVEEIWEHLIAREGCTQGRWWLHGLAENGRLGKRRFELDDVKPGQPGPIRAAEP